MFRGHSLLTIVNRECPLIVTIVLAAILNCVFSVAPGESFTVLANIAGWMAAFMLAAEFGKDPDTREDIVQTFMIGGIAVCAVGFWFWIAGGKTIGALASTFYESDIFAGYLLLLLPLALNLSLFSEGRIRQVLYGLVAALFAVSLFFTYSRGAWIVFGLVFILWIAIVSKKKKIPVRSVMIFAGGAVLLIVFDLLLHRNDLLANNFWEKIFNARSWIANAGARLSFWLGAWKIFIHHPLLGSGLDTFGRLFPQFQERFYWYSRYPHSFYFQLLSDGGILLTIPFFMLMIVILKSGLKRLQNNGREFGVSLGLLLGFVAGMLHLFLDADSNFLLWSILFWGIGGLLWVHPPSAASVLTKRKWGLSLMMSLFFLIVLEGAIQASVYFDGKAQRAILQQHDADAARYETLAIQCYPWRSEYYARRYGLYKDEIDIQTAVKLDPAKALYRDELGDDEARAGNLNEAMTAYRHALDLDPLNYPDIRTSMAGLELRMNHPEAARSIYQDVIRRYPQDRVARTPWFRKDAFIRALIVSHLALADIARREHRSHDADEEVKKALMLDPRHQFIKMEKRP